VPPTTLTQAEFLTNWITTWSAEMNVSVNLEPGDFALAVAEADVGMALTLQFFGQAVINFARAQTSTGVDLDSFYAQFGFTRLPGTFATGQVTFTTVSILTSPVYIPVGSTVQTPNGAITYTVIADNSLPTFNSSQQAYIIPIGQSSANVAVMATTTGTAFNVQAGQLTQVQSNIFGIASLSNTLAIQNGTNPETDAAFRTRFVAYINSLSKATEEAIFEAIDSLQTGLKIQLIANQFLVGNPPTSVINPYYGNIIALVDDGTGNPSSTLISAATAAVDATVAFGIQYQVLKPFIETPPFALQVAIGPSGVENTVIGNIQSAIVTYVNALPIGATVFLSQIIAIAQDADPNVTEVVPHSATINGLEANYVLTIYQETLITAENVSVTVAT